jgi:hypothetical protein
MQTSTLQQALHGWNVMYEEFAYPFKTHTAAFKMRRALWLLVSTGLLSEFKRLRINPNYPNCPIYPIYSSNYYYKQNEDMVEGVIAKASLKQRQDLKKALFPMFFIDYESRTPMFGIQGAQTGRTCAGASVLSNTYTRNGESPRLRLKIDSVLGEKWPGDFKKFTPAYVPPTQQATEQTISNTAEKATPSPAVCSVVGLEPAPTVVESIDPRKIPLLAFVNAEFLPDAPKDDTDMSTEACWKRQARTISGLLRDLEQRTKTLVQTSTELEIEKSKRTEMTNEVTRLANRVNSMGTSLREQSDYIRALCNDNQSYRAQILKNSESIAVVKYSTRDREWHLVLDGAAYYTRGMFPDLHLRRIANAINRGECSVSKTELTRKPYYYKEDYA